MRLRAVLDTSVLLDADRHELLFLARRRLYTPVWSAFIIGEMVRVRTELSLRRGLDPAIHRLEEIGQRQWDALVSSPRSLAFLKRPIAEAKAGEIEEGGMEQP